jgi:hypothetical protein
MTQRQAAASPLSGQRNRAALIMPRNKLEITPRAARNAAIDMAAYAVIILFMLLSLGPVAGVFRGGDVGKVIVNAAFVVTSLWGILLGAAILRWLMSSEYRAKPFGVGRRPAATYALVWCAAYLIYIQALS